MRSIAVTMLLAAAVTGRAQEATRIDWTKDLAAAKERARAEGKPVIAYFTYDT